jgi:hypothetical protein
MALGMKERLGTTFEQCVILFEECTTFVHKVLRLIYYIVLGKCWAFREKSFKGCLQTQ